MIKAVYRERIVHNINNFSMYTEHKNPFILSQSILDTILRATLRVLKILSIVTAE